MRARPSTQYVGTSPRKKILRILFFCVLALSICISVLMLGNILHDRLEKAAPLLALPSVSYTNLTEARRADAYTPYTPAQARPGYYYAPTSAVLAKEDALPEFCRTAAELYSGISVSVRDGDGIRFAAKNAPADAVRQEPYPHETMTALLRAAKEAALPCCAVWQMDASIPDPNEAANALLFEIVSLGFDEILFTTLSADMLSERTVAAAASLAEALKTGSPRLLVGFTVEYNAFTDAEAAPLLEKLAACVDILAVDLGNAPAGTDAAAAFACERAASLYGSIAYYPLRVLVRGAEADAAAQLRALQEENIPAVQIIG